MAGGDGNRTNGRRPAGAALPPRRLWGDPAALSAVLGIADLGDDAERQAVGFAVEAGCRLEGRLAEWRSHGDLCARGREHHRLVYG